MPDAARPPLSAACVSRTGRRPANEDSALAEVLEARGIMHYLPLVRRVRYYGRRKQAVQLPLFPGYLFLCGPLEDAFDWLGTYRRFWEGSFDRLEQRLQAEKGRENG